MASAAPTSPTRTACLHDAWPARTAMTASHAPCVSPGSSAAGWSTSTRWCVMWPTTSRPLPCHALAEQARRPEDEDEDEHREGDHILQLVHGRDAEPDEEQDGTDRLDLTQEDATQHGARDVADATQDGCGEGL